MGTHPIFESDFDCLTDRKMTDFSSSRRAVLESMDTLPRQSTLDQNDPSPAKCFLCEEEFAVGSSGRDAFLSHCISLHKMVIGDVHLISDLHSYVTHWRERFKQGALTDFCAVIMTNSKPTDMAPQEFFFLLSDELPEDRQLRERLNGRRLERILQYQEHDRARDDFCQMCIFCSTKFEGSYAQVVEFFNHMSSKHQFNVGHPDNMVFIEEFIETIRTRLNAFQCLSCVKTFQDRATLKDHMRKKSHRALNKDDRSFDRFYLINYLEIGKRWTHLAKEAEPEGEDEEWIETEDASAEELYCFFCDFVAPSYETLLTHLYDTHDFEYEKICSQLSLSFYQQLKLINWIRMEKVKLGQLDVMEITERILSREWNAPQYYFPTFQEDALLNVIKMNDVIDEDELHVYPEDLCDRQKIRRESVLKDLVRDLNAEPLVHQRKSRHKFQKKPPSKITDLQTAGKVREKS